MKAASPFLTLTIEGVNAALLTSALIDHEVKLIVPGGNTVATTFQTVGDNNGNSAADMTMKVDRQELIQSIQAGIAAGMITPSSVVELVVRARSNGDNEIRVIGVAMNRILGGE